MAGGALAPAPVLARRRPQGARVELGAVLAGEPGQAVAPVLVAGHVPAHAEVLARRERAGVELVAHLAEVASHTVAVVAGLLVEDVALTVLADVHLAVWERNKIVKLFTQQERLCF